MKGVGPAAAEGADSGGVAQQPREDEAVVRRCAWAGWLLGAAWVGLAEPLVEPAAERLDAGTTRPARDNEVVVRSDDRTYWRPVAEHRL